MHLHVILSCYMKAQYTFENGIVSYLHVLATNIAIIHFSLQILFPVYLLSFFDFCSKACRYSFYFLFFHNSHYFWVFFCDCHRTLITELELFSQLYWRENFTWCFFVSFFDIHTGLPFVQDKLQPCYHLQRQECKRNYDYIILNGFLSLLAANKEHFSLV